jgi:type I restriction enzyme, S subunit
MNWGERRLGEFFGIKHGFAFKSEHYDSAGDYVLLTPGNFYEEGGFKSRGEKEIYYTGDVPSNYILNKNDLLVVMTEQAEGLLGSSALIPKDDIFLHNQRLGLVVELNEKELDRLFLYHLFNSNDVRKQISTGAGGTKVRHTSPDKILKVKFRRPSLPEQRKIADILSTWETAVETTEKLIAAKVELKKGLMQQLLTGKKRFQEFVGQEWKQVRLSEVFRERCETLAEYLKRLRDDGKEEIALELLSITARDGVVRRDTLEKRDTSNEDKSKYLRICPGDIGYNTMRMWQGVSGLSEYEGIVSPAYTICTPTEAIDGKFASYLFKHKPIVHLFWRYSQGLVDDTLNLKFHHFAQIKVLLPPIEEQRRIACVLEAGDKEIELLIKQRDALKAQKRGLMQQLLTGKKRVKVDEQAEREAVVV